MANHATSAPDAQPPSPATFEVVYADPAQDSLFGGAA